MATSYLLELDTTSPQDVTVSINSGAAKTASRDASVAIGTSSGDATQVKIWGSVDPADNANIQATEGASSWITLASPHSVKLSTGDGTKTINVKLRDDVDNPNSSATSDTIDLDTTAPVPTFTAGPTPAKISKQTGKRSSAFTFSVPEAIQAWKLKVVPASDSIHSAGTQIPTAGGSTNVTGGALAADTPQAGTIDGADLETAGAEGQNRVKLFVQDQAGNWSI